MLGDVDDMALLDDVTQVVKGPEPLNLSDDVVRDLSHDQKVAYRYYKMIRTGEASLNLTLSSCWNLNLRCDF